MGSRHDRGRAGLIDEAMHHRSPGPYQLQAAIAALHAMAENPEETDWRQIDLLYATLEHLQPSPVSPSTGRWQSTRCAAAGGAGNDRATGAAPQRYFRFFGVKGALLLKLGRRQEAQAAFDRAIALANQPARAAHIRSHLDRLIRNSEAPRA